MQTQTKGTIIALIAFLAVIKLISSAQKQRRNKAIKAPAWGKHVWHYVPDPLLNSLTYSDWKGLCAMHEARAPMFASEERVASFKRDHRVVLSLTTSPLRIKYVPIVLNLLELDWVDEIGLNLPRRFGRNSQTYESIPDSIYAVPKLKIYWFDKDDGPIMKILPTVERESADPLTICVSIDDDIALPRNLIKSLVSASIAFEGRAAVGAKGAQVKVFLPHGQQSAQTRYFESLWPAGIEHPAPLENTVALDLLEGYGGIAYRTKHLDPSPLRKMSSCDKKCFQSDDIVLNMHMQQQGVARMRLNQVQVHPFSFGNQEDALHIMQNHYQAYDKCIEFVTRK